MRSARRTLGVWAALAGLSALCSLTAFAARVHAHEMSMAELELRELSKGQFILTWGASGKNRPLEEDLTPYWPEGCEAREQFVRCGESGLFGPLTIDGVGRAYSAALLRVIWLDRQISTYTLTAAQPSIQLVGAASDQRNYAELARAYFVLGVEHILSGFDHLLFVFGLLFLVGFQRKLIATITAFTLAHSLTLACSALGIIQLRSAPVEACIALSIVLVAREALHEQPTLSRRLPGLIAFVFGLVHGLGFAGALREIGLPQDRVALPLLTFNLGVEAGQLLTVAVAFGLMQLLAPLGVHQARKPALYAIGVVAAYWSFERVLALGA